jgi:protoporphyrinogen oxidase
MPNTSRIVIVGGGITGLVAAYSLLHQPWPNTEQRPQITLLEASPRLGGKIKTIEFAGATVDSGAEGLQLLPEGQALCQQLALTDEFISQRPYKTHIWTHRRMYPMPADMMMGIPTSVLSIVRSRILSIPGMLRAGMDLVLPRTKFSSDPTVSEVIGTRLGSDVLDHLVEPLLAGIHAGDITKLSLSASVPQIADVTLKNRSLVIGLQTLKKARRSQQTNGKASNGKRPGLLSFDKGLSRLVERLQEELEGIDLRHNEAVKTLEQQSDGSYQLTTSRGTTLTAQHVILAIPAQPAAELLQASNEKLAQVLTGIEHASVTVVHLAYRASAFDPKHQQHGSFLTPSKDGHLLKSCANITTKWERTQQQIVKDANGEELVILRCSSGRAGDKRALQMEDEAVITAFHNELVAAIGLRERPVTTHITRWTDAFTQYNSGYKEQLTAIEQQLAQDLPGVALAGADYHGMGLASCIKDGLRVANLIQQRDEQSAVLA